ncbi:putative vacuolar protein sorting-associated protein 32 [Cardamine amara subsp. amara]|uniref:Vacuolar protein sorting-associated protein 32 n=1 Tax=Cardamine amara subsp. amara TaxID=228776 RepID=A0ABD0Z6Y1_CARAN
MIVTWLAGKPKNEIYKLQKTIDDTNKTLESFKQNEKVHLEKAAIKLEEAKEHSRKNDKNGVLHCLKIKMMHEGAAQYIRDSQLTLHEELILMERVKKEVIEALQDKDFTTQKTTHVFIYFCFLLLVLTSFVGL